LPSCFVGILCTVNTTSPKMIPRRFLVVHFSEEDHESKGVPACYLKDKY
jgi:hypothetical protein